MGAPSHRVCFSTSVLIVVGYFVTSSYGHGRLRDPPSRSTMWRYGFNNQRNDNDHQLYCGGLGRQIINNGKCGVCGDPWDSQQPRDNEAGGKYGTGLIVKNYTSGQNISIEIQLTVNHKGYFEFRICPNNNPKKIVSQTCLNKYILKQSNKPGDTRYYPPADVTGEFKISYQLPASLTCTQCVLQWRYMAGNNWGKCDNGTGRVGCGIQEEFRACADVAITDKTGTADNTESSDSDKDIIYPNPNVDIDVTTNVDDNDDNYVSKDYKPYDDLGGHDSFYAGFIIAGVSLLLAILLLAVVILYSYPGRMLIKEMLYEKTASRNSQQYGTLHNDARNKKSRRPLHGVKQLRLPNTLQVGKLAANNISSPIAVTINGISVKSDMNIEHDQYDIEQFCILHGGKMNENNLYQ